MVHDLLVDLGQVFVASGDEARAAASRDRGDGGKPGETDGSTRTTTSPLTFHVTEYDVIKRQYPQSWEDHAGASHQRPQQPTFASVRRRCHRACEKAHGFNSVYSLAFVLDYPKSRFHVVDTN